MKDILSQLRKENNKLKASRRKVVSFHSSLMAALFVGVGFIPVTYFVPLGEEGWITSWIFLSVVIVVSCAVYYGVGLSLIRKLHSDELIGFKYNFLASIICAVYISIVTLFRPTFIYATFITTLLLIVAFLIYRRIANNKYRRNVKNR